ncbi:MAG: hypothetical protein L0I06_02760 [Acidipropionibacterium jensenii]|nr:hypothetical protein [Acidipropionibacterium jensenii]
MDGPCRRELAARVSRILFDADPIGIAVEPHVDEYDSEADEIIDRLPDAQDAADTRSLVHQVFVTWFDDQIAGPEDRYTSIADQIWALWHGGLDTSVCRCE